jgi:hypothetical protein
MDGRRFFFLSFLSKDVPDSIGTPTSRLDVRAARPPELIKTVLVMVSHDPFIQRLGPPHAGKTAGLSAKGTRSGSSSNRPRPTVALGLAFKLYLFLLVPTNHQRL